MRRYLLGLAFALSICLCFSMGIRARADGGNIQVVQVGAESRYPDGIRFFVTTRSPGLIDEIKEIRRILNMLTTDSQFRAFHEGKSQMLPEFYHHEYSRMLGPYASLLSRADATPDLSPAAALPKRAQESVTVETV